MDQVLPDGVGELVLFQVNCLLLTDLIEPLNLECNLESKYIYFDEIEVLMKQEKR